jgi:hypothetical protein
MIRSAFILGLLSMVSLGAESLSVDAYGSIQAALDANPGKALFVPASDYVIHERIRIRGDGSGLFGPGRIIQQNPEQPIINVEDAADVVIRDLTLMRPNGKMETRSEGVVAVKCSGLVLDNVRVYDNRSAAGAITVRESRHCRISRCVVRNYMRVSVDDRTVSKDYGYAFNCTDGTGISVSYSTGTLIEGNRVLEENLVPTPEMKAKHKLGDFVKKNPEKGAIISQQLWDANYTDVWQQGSGIIVTAPTVSDCTRIVNNHIENAAQGIDLHTDHVIVANNIVVNSFMGMKAMHGSRNVLITGNQFIKNCIWAIGLMPGAAANAENSDGGSIIANNIISDFGYGDAHWIWGKERSPFKFDNGQQPDDPPLTDVVIQGNVLHTTGERRYRYAVVIAGGENAPRGLHFSNNLLPPGKDGVANTELPP